MKFIHQHFGGFIDKIPFICGNIRDIGGKRNSRLCLFLNFKHIIHLYGLHDHADFMVAVSALPNYIKSKIYFCKCT